MEEIDAIKYLRRRCYISLKLILICSVIAFAIKGGTAFPICIKIALFVPLKINSSSKD